jgi:PEP-CTERM motif-containing protein
MKRISFLMSAFAVGLLTAPVSAGSLNVSGVFSSKPDGANFDYTITLSNLSSSTVSLETFWFGWVPGQNYLATKPISETTPSGWTVDLISHGTPPPPDGYAIRFVTTTAPLMPGQSLSFGFVSADTPAEIAGNSLFHANPPAGTSTVYQGGPFSGASAQFVVLQSVPEPSTLTLGIIGVLGSFAAGRARRAVALRRADRLVSAHR